MGQPSLTSLAVLLGVTSAVALADLWKVKAYNVLTLPLLLSGLVYHGVNGRLPEFTDSVTGALFGFGVLVTFYMVGAVGAGEVKLMAGVGAWLGVTLTFYVFLVCFVAAAGYLGLVALTSGKPRVAWVNLRVMWDRLRALARHLGADRGPTEAGAGGQEPISLPLPLLTLLGILALLLYSSDAAQPEARALLVAGVLVIVFLLLAHVLRLGPRRPRPGQSPSTQAAEDASAPAPSGAREGRERRRGERRFGNPVPVQILYSVGGTPQAGSVRDRSSGGLGLLAEQAAPVGAVLRVRAANGAGPGDWVDVEVRHFRRERDAWLGGCQFLGAPASGTLEQFG